MILFYGFLACVFVLLLLMLVRAVCVHRLSAPVEEIKLYGGPEDGGRFSVPIQAKKHRCLVAALPSGRCRYAVYQRVVGQDFVYTGMEEIYE